MIGAKKGTARRERLARERRKLRAHALPLARQLEEALAVMCAIFYNGTDYFPFKVPSDPSSLRDCIDSTCAELRAAGRKLPAYSVAEVRSLPAGLPRRRRRHSRSGQVRCEICSPLRCSEARR